MKIVTLLTGLLLYTNLSFAGESSFISALVSEYEQKVGRIAIFSTGDNNYVIEIDPSHCDAVTKLCATGETEKIKARGKAVEGGFYFYNPELGAETLYLKSGVILSMKPVSKTEVHLYYSTSQGSKIIKATPQFFVGGVPSVEKK